MMWRHFMEFLTTPPGVIMGVALVMVIVAAIYDLWGFGASLSAVVNRYLEEKTKAQKDLAEWRAFLESQILPTRFGPPRTWRQSDLWKLQKGRCWLCGKPLDRSFISRDHLHPVSKGGAGKPNNILLAHRSCNAKRGNQGIYTLEEALAILERHSENGSARQLCIQCTGWLDEHRHWCPSLLKSGIPQCPWCGGEHVGTDCKAEKSNADTKV